LQAHQEKIDCTLLRHGTSVKKHCTKGFQYFESQLKLFLQKGLDLPHTHLALDELAKLHAASHAYIMSKAKESSLEDVLKVQITFS
jgi:hypothetical protein